MESLILGASYTVGVLLTLASAFVLYWPFGVISDLKREVASLKGSRDTYRDYANKYRDIIDQAGLKR